MTTARHTTTVAFVFLQARELLLSVSASQWGDGNQTHICVASLNLGSRGDKLCWT